MTLQPSFKQRPRLLSSKCENFVVFGDFNSQNSNTAISDFCVTYNLTIPIKGAYMF